jgi:hypothetical protein
LVSLWRFLLPIFVCFSGSTWDPLDPSAFPFLGVLFGWSCERGVLLTHEGWKEGMQTDRLGYAIVARW